MNYEDMDSQINLEKSNIKRNMTAIRTKNPNSHSNQSIYNIAPEDIQSNLLSKFKKRKPQSIMGKLPPTKKSKTRIKNYRRQLNNYQ